MLNSFHKFNHIIKDGHIPVINNHMPLTISVAVFLAVFGFTCLTSSETNDNRFDTEKDLISLHYDHAPDKDDGHSAAADRTVIEGLLGREWAEKHTLAVSGTYGINADEFNPASDAVMDAAWNCCGGWYDAHRYWDESVEKVAAEWYEVLYNTGGDIWIKEGGQSDFSADVVRKIRSEYPDIDTKQNIHTIQHSEWNENKTTPEDLAYVREHTHYIKIDDANAYLNKRGGDEKFEEAALQHPIFGSVWEAAFHYYDPDIRLDFSDTGELFYILELGTPSLESIRSRFLEQ